MYRLGFVRTCIESVVVSMVILTSLFSVSAQVRSSGSYQMQSDSINFAGGLSTSSSFALESTAGEVATGDSESATYQLRAGYQQMQEVFISLTAQDAVEMVGTLGGLTGGESNGSSSVTVITDSPAGYQLLIAANGTPAMRKGVDSIADYVPDSSPNPDFMFTTASNEAHFGLSPHGDDIVSRFKNNTALCAVGSIVTPLRCWVGLTTSNQVIAIGAGANHPQGATTTLQFKVGIGSQAVVMAGTYVATTTLTALPL